MDRIAEWIQTLVPNKQMKMAKQLDVFVEKLNELFLQFLHQKQKLDEKKFQADCFITANPEVDFSLNERKGIYDLAHYWIILLVIFCILADYYIMREIAGQFGISNPNLGIVVGFLLLTIELTLAALAISRPGVKDQLSFMNQVGKYTFLLFIPSMCYLSYIQNVSNVELGATETSLEIVQLKMIFISAFSLLIHFLLVHNLEKGLITMRDKMTVEKYKGIQAGIDKNYKTTKTIVQQIQLTGANYLRERDRYNRQFPDFAKRVEYLPDGVISLINDGQQEDIINLKQSTFTQTKPGFSSGALFRMKLNKFENDEYTMYLKEKERQKVKTEEASNNEPEVHIESEVQTESEDKIGEEESPIPESFQSFFGKMEKSI